MTHVAVLDRFEGDRAVLVVESDEPEELVCDASRLPAEGREPDAVFRVRIENEELHEVTYLPDETTRRADRSQGRFDRLSQRLGGGGGDGSDDESGDETDESVAENDESVAENDESGDETDESGDETDESVAENDESTAADPTDDHDTSDE